MNATSDYETWVSERANSIVKLMTFGEFVACVKATDKRLAWGTRTHYHFIVNGEELMFSYAEMGRFKAYFHPDMYMTDFRFKLLLENGAAISRLAFDEIDIFSLNLNGKGKKFAHSKLCKNYDPCKSINWIASHDKAIAKAKACQHNNDAIIAEYGTNNPRVGRELRNGEVWLTVPSVNHLYMEFGK